MKSNIFRLPIRKRFSSGSSEKFQYELDKSKSNKTVLKFDDKQTVTYVSNSASQSSGNLPPGISLIHLLYILSYTCIYMLHDMFLLLLILYHCCAIPVMVMLLVDWY